MTAHGEGGSQERPIQDRKKLARVLCGRRRSVPMLILGACFGIYDVIAGAAVVRAIYWLALSAWLGITAWRFWHEPFPSPQEVRRLDQRRAWLGTHPVYGALLSGVALATVMFLSGWPSKHLEVGLIVCGATGAFIGFGLFLVFRSDPQFKPPDELQS